MAKIPIPDDWDGESWCEWAICWPDSELYEGLLRGLITNLTRGRYWDETTGSVVDAQQVGYQILDRNILLRRCIVSCTEGIENAIRYLADAIYNKPCCPGADGGGVPGGANGGVPGLVTTPTTGQTYPTIGEEVPYTLPDGQTWPEALFSTEQDYQDYKCAAANQIVDGAVSTLRALGALTIANITGAAVIVGLAFAGAIAFPPAGIPILLSAIGALAGGLVVLQQLGDNIQTNRQDYICALYEGESTNAAIGAVLELIDEAMATLAFGATVQPYVRIVATFVFSTDTVNRLFNALLDYNYPGADCSGCDTGPCDLVTVSNKGVIESITDNGDGSFTYRIRSEFVSAFSRQEFELQVPDYPGACCFVDCEIAEVQSSGAAYGLAYNRCDETYQIDGGWTLGGHAPHGWLKSLYIWTSAGGGEFVFDVTVLPDANALQGDPYTCP